VVVEVAQHPGQGHFCGSRLEAFVHRGLDPALRFGIAHAFAEEIGIATEVLGRRERGRIDPILERDTTGSRKPGDPMCERSDESPSALAGNARLIQPYRSASSAS
jgi:hypothetical protein